jgi:dTDP-4-amino-4,6-dideoxygalactose transaminase
MKLIDDLRGDYICYSFQAIKFLTCGDGGLLICPKEKEEEARLMRWYGLDRTKGESFRCTQNIKTPSGFKYHMNDISATIGLANIEEAKKSVDEHLMNSCKYRSRIKNENFILPSFDIYHSYWLFSMHVLNGKKQKFIEYMTDKDISVSPVHFRNDLYDCTKQFKEKELPGVTEFQETQICVPCGWWLSESDKEYIISTMNKFD